MEQVPDQKPPLQNTYKSFQDGIPVSKSRIAPLLELIDERQPASALEPENLEELFADSNASEVPAMQGHLRPSPTTWRIILTIGDGLLLLNMLALLPVLAPALHEHLVLSNYVSGIWSPVLLYGCLALLSWSIALKITQAQKLQIAYSPLKSSLSAILALTLMIIFWIGISYPFFQSSFIGYAKLLLLFFSIAMPAFCLWRILLAEVINSVRFRLQAVIVGDNPAGETIARELQLAKRPGIKVLGYIGENSDEKMQRDRLTVLGGRNMLRQLIRSGVLDMIIMAIDFKTNPMLLQEAIEAVQLGVTVVPMAMVYERTSGKIAVEHIGDQWYASLPSEPSVSLFYLCWSKAIDLAFGLVGTLILFLLLPILALLIRLDSTGPIFYSQERLGYQGRPFRILKFRSMRTDAEHKGQAVWATKGDSRVTRIGKILRITHLDELPQVLNILRGEMSLIGPRPERQEFVARLEKAIPFYRCRLSVKPGLTGWAQVKYSYTSTGSDALIKLQYDLYYIKHQSITLDISIMVKTVVEMLLCRGR